MKFKTVTLIKFLALLALLTAPLAVTPASAQSAVMSKSMAQVLADLGGSPCFEGSAFTCVTLDVPLDHFNQADSRNLGVTFAVLPATGVRKGMFVTATGGPGYSGIASADSYLATFDPAIPQAFDIVFFDQRGVGLSGDQACPFAANVYYQQDARGITRKQEAALKQNASAFSAGCVSETSNPELLPLLGTRQAVEDLEYFRQLVGDDKLWLYGESYGTQYAQTYAAAHSEHLGGLILDGTVDLTLTGNAYYAQQAQAFNDTLVASLSACKDDPVCRRDLNGKPVAGYDTLAAILRKGPLTFNYPLPEGGFAKRQFTLINLEFTAVSQMYNEGDRMMFVRALAAFTSKADLVPLARLFYLNMGLDPQTLAVLPSPFFSDAAYYGVECQDYGYAGDTPNQKADNYLRAADPFEVPATRFASILYSDLPCAYWPGASSDLTRPDYLSLVDVPTLVLGSTADPATPVGNGVSVYQHLANGYLITQSGGPHVIFGRGNACPDVLVTDFLVNDRVPAERETLCDGFVMDTYVPVAPRFAIGYKSPYKAFSSFETEIYYLPEFYYWDGMTPTTVGCTYGGTLSFTPSTSGYEFSMDGCALTANFILTGTGNYDVAVDRFQVQAITTGRWKCALQYTRVGEAVDVSGTCDGKFVHEKHKDEDTMTHKIPDLTERKKETNDH